jgi:phosphoserine phosphatase RsbU/P
VADTAVGEVRLANAGHPTPFHLERASGRVSPCALPYGPGPALGLMPDFVYDTVARPMAAGDAVLLFTDGVYEVEGPDGEQLGQTGLGDAITARLAQDTPQLLDGLLEDVKAYRGGGIDILPDDVCLVAVDCV